MKLHNLARHASFAISRKSTIDWSVLDVPLSVISRRRLSEEVADLLRQEIVTGAIEPSQRLIESDVAERLGVSKSPVREAIRVLVNEGLLVSRPRRGTLVAEFSEVDFWEINSIRGLLEGFAAELIIRRNDATDLNVLQDVIGQMSTAKGSEALSALHLTFHRTLVEMSGHSRLIDTWNNLEPQIRLYLTLTQFFYRRHESVAEAHQPILDALGSKDADKCRRLLAEQAEPHLRALIAMRQSKERQYVSE